MARIEIEWLHDTSPDCETCGSSYAEGARVKIDGEVALNLEPRAHCFGGDHWNESDVYVLLLKKLGHTVEDGSTQESEANGHHD